jgi:outer membrane protein insertion porin family
MEHSLMRRQFKIFSFFFSFCLSAQAELAGFADQKIDSIHFVGLKKISEDALLAKIGCQKQAVLNPKMIRQDIKTLYETGYFSEITFQAENVNEKTVLTIELKELPVVQEIVYEGNHSFEEKDFKDTIKVKNFDILNLNRIQNDVTALQKFYEEKGFNLAKISFEIDPLPENQVKLRYKIQEFEKLIIKKITFLNNHVFSEHQLKKIFAETKEADDLSPLLSDAHFKETGFKQDMQRLRLWYWDHGYAQFQHEEPLITMSDDKQFIFISVYLEEGDLFNQGSIGFEGDLLFSQKELEDSLTLKTAMTFRISQQQQDIIKLQERYQDLGYAFVNVMPKTRLRPEEKLIDVIYEFEKGDLVHFGEIRISGNDKTLDRVIRRELKIKEGQLYNGTHFRESKENIERLGFFTPNEIAFNTIAVPDRTDVLDVEIIVKERSTGTVNFGAGAGSLQGIFLQAQVSEQNFLGRGQNLSFSAQYSLSQMNRGLNFGFFDPYAFNSKWSAGSDIYYTIFAIPNRYSSSRLGFDVKTGHPLFEYTSFLTTYRLEGNNVLGNSFSLNTDLPESVQQQIVAQQKNMSAADTGILSSLQLQIVRDKRNNRLEPTAGSYQMGSIEFAGLGGDMKFFKLMLNSRFYTRIVSDLILRNNSQIGHIASLGRAIPPSHKFYLGGPSDMKGFYPFQLGPQSDIESFSQPLGGNFLAYTMTELEYPLLRELGLKGLLFFDIGNNWDHIPSFSSKQPFLFRADYGLGVRFFMPMGHIQLTFGWPVAPRSNEDSGPVFGLFFGPPF